MNLPPLSHQGIPLLYRSGYSVPVVTVENTTKWYQIFIVYPSGTVKVFAEGACTLWDLAERQFLEKFGVRKSHRGDHCWHPAFVEMLAELLCGEVDPIAREILIGRWWLETKNKTTEDL